MFLGETNLEASRYLLPMFVPSLTENLEIVAESRGPCVFLRYVQH